MADTIISPNMSLPVPVASVCPGPAWATDITACMSILDQHTHAPGSGVLITQNGINLTPAATTFDSLGFNTSNAFDLRSIKFTPQGSALGLGTDIGCMYEAGVDLYYNDGNGNQIRLTQSGSPVGGGGSITGLPSGTASASYSAGTFVWQSATNVAANMDAGAYIFRNGTAMSKGLTLSPPNAMAANYALTLPALPGGTSFVTLDTSGNISGAILTSAGLTGSNIQSNVNLSGKAVKEGGNNVIVSNTNATNSLAMIRGAVSAVSAITAGEGFSVVSGGIGIYTVSFTTAFGDTPVVVASCTALIDGVATISAASTSGCTIKTVVSTNAGASNAAFSFIAIGQRA